MKKEEPYMVASMSREIALVPARPRPSSLAFEREQRRGATR